MNLIDGLLGVVASLVSYIQNLGNFIQPTLSVSFGRDSNSRWSLPSGVYTMESKRSHTGKWKKPVVDSVCHTELVISISKLTILYPSLAVISCKGSISSSIKLHLPSLGNQ